MAPENHQVEVQVKSLKTGETAKFKINDSATLQMVWDTALAKDQLNETRNTGDIFRCAKGQDLSAFLNNTLAQLAKEKVCEDRHFEIKGPSGGAIA